MSGSHQLWICLLAVVVAGLTAIPLELQRRIVDEVVRDREMELLWLLAGGYLAVLLVQGVTKYAMHMYQSRASPSMPCTCTRAGSARAPSATTAPTSRASTSRSEEHTSEIQSLMSIS